MRAYHVHIEDALIQLRLQLTPEAYQAWLDELYAVAETVDWQEIYRLARQKLLKIKSTL